MTTPFPKIVCTDDTLGGSPRVDGRRLAVGDVIATLNSTGLKVAIEDFDLTMTEIRDALLYCSSLQCNADKPKVFCHNCSLRRDQEGPLDISQYQEVQIDGEFFVKGNGMTFFGSMSEFLEDHAGQDFWKISTDLLINFNTELNNI